MIIKFIDIFIARGISGLLHATKSRIRGLLARRARSFPVYENLFIGKSGIEIGGPSQVFSRRGIFPIYPIVENIDNCNFSCTTVWEGAISQGKTYRFDPKKSPGEQHIVDATAMGGLSPEAYDFVLSSHMLEHTANPILALSEWKRLLKNEGILVLLLPDSRHTFDHRRSVTSMEHLIADFNAEMKENDLTHLPEILALHDSDRDPDAGNTSSFTSRSLRNFENRCLHHHVFDAQLAVSLVEYAGLKVQAIEESYPHHILLVAKKK